MYSYLNGKIEYQNSDSIVIDVNGIGYKVFVGTAWYDGQPDGLIYAGKVVYGYKGTMPDNTSIVIKDGTKGIAGSAFSGCSRLTSITIPKSVTTIGGSAFSECTSLTSIIIPSSVTNIGWSAFYGCNSLSDVYCYATQVPSCNYFYIVPMESATLHVPASAIDDYRNTAPWNRFGTIVALTDEEDSIKSATAVVSNDGINYDINGLRRTAPQRGLNIIHMSDGTIRKVMVK